MAAKQQYYICMLKNDILEVFSSITEAMSWHLGFSPFSTEITTKK